MRNIIKTAYPVFMELSCYKKLNIQIIVLQWIDKRKKWKIVSVICENESKENKASREIFITKNRNMLTQVNNDDIIQKIYALAPLSQLMGCAAFIRSISKGEG